MPVLNDTGVTYDYAVQDRIAEPNTYNYSTFHGAEFLVAWRASRQKVIDCLHAFETCRTPADSSNRDLAIGPTAALVDIAMGQAAALVPGAPLASPLKDLLHKFETTKRLHRAYDDRLRAVDRSLNRDLGLYLKFADVLAEGYRRSSDLRFVNALLKIADTLCSVAPTLEPHQMGWLRGILLEEQRIVSELESTHLGSRAEQC